MRNPFYVVWEPSTGYTKYRHVSQREAQREAERLAAQNPNREFIVLYSVGGALSRTIEPIEFDHDPIPF